MRVETRLLGEVDGRFIAFICRRLSENESNYDGFTAYRLTVYPGDSSFSLWRWEGGKSVTLSGVILLQEGEPGLVHI